ncbi:MULTISPECIES: hypothetical protein [unclassified Nocardioides]|uniref:hypothetical protein n=1 Tax=unclassified Nocardioides TaxID=2615069 RepID=UPI0007023EFC|nr:MULTISPECIES: hypothetical protein [unclassified Nocardioides]KRC55053.1 hypothetical protein ASE19_06340 [Nocardioides sp. Root79]KRC72049.1 hypothetical protein ASE20_05205 [Nocardioides sp. Root240]
MVMRGVGALAAVVTAAVHLYLWFDGVRDQGTVGQLFLVNVVAGAVIAVLLVAWRSWVPLLLLAGLGATTLAAFVISTTAGLYGIHTTWDSWYAWVAAVSEAGAVLVAAAAASAEGWLTSLRSRVDAKH